MPYNTAAIPLGERSRAQPNFHVKFHIYQKINTDSMKLVSRVRKIVQVDQDINICSNAASFMITLATEMFIQYLAEQGHTVVKSERKPRRNIQYRDLSQAVHRNDNLEFLADIVPKTVPFKEVKEKKAPKASAVNGSGNGEGSGGAGQTTLDGVKNLAFMNGGGGGMNGFVDHAGPSGNGNGDVDDDSTIADPNEQLRMESRGVSSRVSNGSSVALNGRHESEDVEMS